MCNGPDCSAGCWMMCILGGILWLLVSSGLLMFVWNTVVAGIAAVKKIPFWHALLVVLFLVILFGPLCHGGPRGGMMRCDDDKACMEEAKSGCGGDMQCKDMKGMKGCDKPCGGRMAKPDSTR
jgi:hypothetical protein